MTLPGVLKSAGVAALLSISVLSLAGCGRRGDLDAASSASATPAAAPAGGTGVDGAAAQPKTSTKAVAPKQNFLLDPVL